MTLAFPGWLVGRPGLVCTLHAAPAGSSGGSSRALGAEQFSAEYSRGLLHRPWGSLRAAHSSLHHVLFRASSCCGPPARSAPGVLRVPFRPRLCLQLGNSQSSKLGPPERTTLMAFLSLGAFVAFLPFIAWCTVF